VVVHKHEYRASGAACARLRRKAIYGGSAQRGIAPARRRCVTSNASIALRLQQQRKQRYQARRQASDGTANIA